MKLGTRGRVSIMLPELRSLRKMMLRMLKYSVTEQIIV
jgi:hypothetical protein